MKLSVLANLYGAKPLDETLSILSGLGVHTVEIGAGGYPGKAHCNPEALLKESEAYDAFVATITEALKEGDKIQLVGFGSFELKEKGEREIKKEKRQTPLN